MLFTYVDRKIKLTRKWYLITIKHTYKKLPSVLKIKSNAISFYNSIRFCMNIRDKMAAQRKLDGAPNTKYFEAVETIAQFDSIRTWLHKNCKKVTHVEGRYFAIM